MNLFRWGSARKENAQLKAELANLQKKYNAVSPTSGGTWRSIFDWMPTAWQANAAYGQQESVSANPTVFACSTLIASDISKLPLAIQQQNQQIWQNANGHAYSKLLRRPNAYQTRQQFIEYWVLSKQFSGNTYGLIKRQGRQVAGIDLLNPDKVQPLVSESGEVFYRISDDQLTPIEKGQAIFPATEVIHDRFNCLHHPLIGTSPIYAAGTTALAGLAGINNMQAFLKNGSTASGLLTAPGSISDTTAKNLKEYWQNELSGSENAGKIAVAGDGLKFEQLRMSNVDAQLIEILKWDDEKIASVYHVPGYMVGLGTTPAYNNIEALSQAYYSQCLQGLIEAIEATLDHALDIDLANHRTQVGVEALFRMDTKTQLEAIEIGGRAGVYSPNESRAKLNLAPVPGGEFPYLQQQNYSLQALADRDKTNPLAAPEPQPTPEDMQNALSAVDAAIKIVNPAA